VCLQKNWRSILDHPHKKGTSELSTIEQISTSKGEACQNRAEVMAESHLSLCTGCTTIVTQTIAQKIAQYSYYPKEK
jgi:hypothetical protein